MSRPAIRAAICDYRPDLVFQIDHLRYELGDIVPARLPFVCWIQDHLVNLTTPAAGESIDERDFVLTGGVYRYVGRYNYPRRQCIDMPKVSRVPALPASWTCDRHDLLYVSHWSQTPEAIIVETCARIREISGAGAESTMRSCTTEMTRVYADSGALRSDMEVRQLVHRVCAARGETLSPEAERFFVDVLFQRLNNALYRRQALLWAGAIADGMGLSFGIYGAGWEKHPELGRWARGVVKYGPDLEALTRESKILLQLEPYACFTHQRMLDALLAGGFALIRAHPLNALPIRIRKFLDAHVPADVNNVDDARACLGEARRHEFDALIAESQIITDLGDLVDVVRGWQRAGTIGDCDEALPHLDKIAFDDLDTMRAHVRHFMERPPERARIAGDQRACVVDRLTYVNALRRATAQLHRLLRDSIQRQAVDSNTVAEAA